jgi:hypothetical protein
MKNMMPLKKFLVLGLIQALSLQAAAAPSKISQDLKVAAHLVEVDQDAQAEKLLNIIIAKATGEEKYEAYSIFARMKFQEKKFRDAIFVYKMIPSTSKFWVESVEERAWADLNLGDFEQAMSLYHTLSAEALASVVGPEAFLVGAISSLRICDYKSVFDDIKLFKTRFKPRIQNLNKTIASENNSAKRKNAELDLASIQSVIKKMHIVEIEAIQRMGLKRTASTEYIKQASLSDDTLTFPKESEEWLDEARFDLKNKHCQVPVQKTGAIK